MTTLDLLDLHERAMAEFDRRVHAVGADQWNDSTPCEQWDVRTLVAHLVDEQLWVPGLLDRRPYEEVGRSVPDDVLGSDPVAAWEKAAREARDAFTRPGALDGTVRLSYGEVGVDHYCRQMAHDLLIHAWDLARGIDADDRLDADAVSTTSEQVRPNAGELAGTGLFAPPVDVPDDADEQTRLLALFGRRR